MKKETNENPPVQAQLVTTPHPIVNTTIITNTPPLSPEAQNAAEEFLKIKKALTGEDPEKVWCYRPFEKQCSQVGVK